MRLVEINVSLVEDTKWGTLFQYIMSGLIDS